MNWTAEDIHRAALEGWQRIPGYVTGTYPRDLTIEAIVRMIYQKSLTSEWHRDVYLSLPWHTPDRAIASHRGWAIVGSDIRNANFERVVDELDIVKAGADKGDPLCIKAIAHITKLRLIGK